MKRRFSNSFPNQLAAPGFTFPARRTSWKLLSVAFLLTTDATVANRLASLVIGDSTNVSIITVPGTIVPASTNQIITFANQLALQTLQAVSSIPLPDDFWIQPQWVVSINVSSAGAADTLTNIVFQTEAFDEKEVARNAPSGQDA